MTPLLALYRGVTWIASPLAPLLLQRRVTAGKEDPWRLHERLGRDLPARPEGVLVWCHGASVGESVMLAGLMARLQAERDDISILYTSQTRTAADILASKLGARDRHQFAPVDTPGATARFLDHWAPDVGLVAEGEIWPNLLLAAKARGVPMALVNARSTQASLDGWARVKGAASAVFDAFDTIIAADERTAAGLSAVLGRRIDTPGNLKSALAPPPPDGTVPTDLAGGGPVLLAASTHDGEERLIASAWRALPAPRPPLIIAPRHPERAKAIRSDLNEYGLTVAQRSLGEGLGVAEGERRSSDSVYLADTLGEMGLWYRTASLVYLGGGHAPGVGGHNPMEPLRLGKPVITGPNIGNFLTVCDPLVETGGLTIAEDGAALTNVLAEHFSGTSPLAIDTERLAAFFAEADTPMAVTLAAVHRLLDGAQTR